jgi:putative tricarboxylic transport membrane protein
VYTGDAAEASQQIKAGSKIRVLAIMSDKRLAGELSNIPTAKEQGVDVDWPIIRGFYMGPKVSDADFALWSTTFNKMMATPAYNKLRGERGLFEFAMTGPELDAYVKKQVAYYRKVAADFGLAVAK